MPHKISMVHTLTQDESGVYMDFRENGNRIYVTDIKKNTYFHLTQADGGYLPYQGLQLLDEVYHLPVCAYMPTGNSSGVMGFFYDEHGQEMGAFETVGSSENLYYVARIQGIQYDCYTWTHRMSPCLMIYQNGEQKAMLIEDKLSHNQMFSMTLHLIDSEHMAWLCMIAYVYHDIANVHNMRSTFHSKILVNGLEQHYQAYEANYHMEYQTKGIGKNYYNVNFLRPFYPQGSEMLEEMEVTPQAVLSEVKQGMKAAMAETYTKENIEKRLLKDPKAIALLIFVAAVMCFTFGFIGYASFGIYGFILGFVFAFIIVAISYGLFFLLVYMLWKIFSKDNK